MIRSEIGVPVKQESRYGDDFFVCPSCGEKVGGYFITGGGDNDWGYHQDNFCSNCGMKMNWENVQN